MSSIQTDNQGSASPIEDGWLARVRYRKAVEADLREIEWEGAYSKYRQVYENVYQRAGSGLALMWVAELPEFNRGLGANLMTFIEQDLIQRGFRELTLNVAEDNEGALRLYQRLGYSILKEISGKWSFYDEKGKLQKVVEPGYRLIKVLKS
jgi:GNAT superfamily N-acetyltransferase